ncbi:MAG: hypothetical protein FJ295_01175 [Planctomycetes bacterium]|nr:hypothetical protein [Planctomycetota bacterium]
MRLRGGAALTRQSQVRRRIARGRVAQRALYFEGLESRQLLAGDVAAEPLFSFRLEIEDAAGGVVHAAAVGAPLWLNLYVRDLAADGVFAAYVDIEFPSALLATSGGIQFSDDFTNFRSGQLSAGLIDEVGAAASLAPTGSAELHLLRVPFTATHAGVARFQTSPADILPAHDTLVYGNNHPIPQTAIVYDSIELVIGDGGGIIVDPPEPVRSVSLSTQIKNEQGAPIREVRTGESFAVEVHADDTRSDEQGVFAYHVDLPFDARLVRLDRLEYSDDFSNGKLANSEMPGHLFVSAFGGLKSNSADDQLLFRAHFTAMRPGDTAILVRPLETPPAKQWLLYGLDEPLPVDHVQATGAALGIRGPGSNTLSVEVTLRATNLLGNDISETAQGSDFRIEAWVRDLRPQPQGIFAAYVDMAFDENKVAVVGPIHHGDDFSLVTSGRVGLDGILDEVGGIGGLSSPAPAASRLLFRVPMRADANGSVTFQTNPTDLSPRNDLLIYGLDTPVSLDRVRFGAVSLQILPAVQVLTANPDSYALQEDSALRVDVGSGVLANDPPMADRTAILVVPPRLGRIAFNADGSFGYQPFPNVNGVDHFQYVMLGDQQSSERTEVRLEIAAKADGPLTKPERYALSATGLLDVPAERGVLVNDLDPDGDPLQARLESLPRYGSIELDADGSFVYRPNSAGIVEDRFTYRAYDGTYMSAPTPVVLSPSGTGSVMNFQLDVVNMQGQTLHVVPVGSQFQIVVSAQDLRPDGLGILSAGVVLPLDLSALEATEVQLNPLFSLFGFASVEDGRVELGGSTGFNPLTHNQLVEFGRITLRALAERDDLEFGAVLAPESQNYLTGFAMNQEVLSLIPHEMVTLNVARIDIVAADDPARPLRSRWQNQNPYDVNGDQRVEPLDAAKLISMINFLATNAASEGPDRLERYAVPNLFSDINGDYDTTPQDGILLINYLNDRLRQAQAASGEMAAMVSDGEGESTINRAFNADASGRSGTNRRESSEIPRLSLARDSAHATVRNAHRFGEAHDRALAELDWSAIDREVVKLRGFRSELAAGRQGVIRR